MEPSLQIEPSSAVQEMNSSNEQDHSIYSQPVTSSVMEFREVAADAELPSQIMQCLIHCGFDTIAAVANLTDIGVIQNFYRDNYSLFENSPKRTCIYGIYASVPEKFALLPGHATHLKNFIDLCKKKYLKIALMKENRDKNTAIYFEIKEKLVAWCTTHQNDGIRKLELGKHYKIAVQHITSETLMDDLEFQNQVVQEVYVLCGMCSVKIHLAININNNRFVISNATRHLLACVNNPNRRNKNQLAITGWSVLSSTNRANPFPNSANYANASGLKIESVESDFVSDEEYTPPSSPAASISSDIIIHCENDGSHISMKSVERSNIEIIEKLEESGRTRKNQAVSKPFPEYRISVQHASSPAKIPSQDVKESKDSPDAEMTIYNDIKDKLGKWAKTHKNDAINKLELEQDYRISVTQMTSETLSDDEELENHDNLEVNILCCICCTKVPLSYNHREGRFPITNATKHFLVCSTIPSPKRKNKILVSSTPKLSLSKQAFLSKPSQSTTPKPTVSEIWCDDPDFVIEEEENSPSSAARGNHSNPISMSNADIKILGNIKEKLRNWCITHEDEKVKKLQLEQHYRIQITSETLSDDDDLECESHIKEVKVLCRMCSRTIQLSIAHKTNNFVISNVTRHLLSCVNNPNGKTRKKTVKGRDTPKKKTSISKPSNVSDVVIVNVEPDFGSDEEIPRSPLSNAVISSGIHSSDAEGPIQSSTESAISLNADFAVYSEIKEKLIKWCKTHVNRQIRDLEYDQDYKLSVQQVTSEMFSEDVEFQSYSSFEVNVLCCSCFSKLRLSTVRKTSMEKPKYCISNATRHIFYCVTEPEKRKKATVTITDGKLSPTDRAIQLGKRPNPASDSKVPHVVIVKVQRLPSLDYKSDEKGDSE